MQEGGHLQRWPLSSAWRPLDRAEDARRQSAVCTQRALPEADPIRTSENSSFPARQMALISKDWTDATLRPCADPERANMGHSSNQEHHPPGAVNWPVNWPVNSQWWQGCGRWQFSFS